MRDRVGYLNCISLGWYCGTASAMGKHGLRSCSGPFDWCWSDLKSVVEMVDTGFADFMKRENLILRSGKPKAFRDIKYGFDCFHDITHDLDTDYEMIHSKYMRRAERFLGMLTEPTLLIRAIRSGDEVDYIEHNHEHIDEVFKRFNLHNSVIYVFPDNIGIIPDTVDSFPLHIDSYGYDAASLREMFDGADELLRFVSDSFDQDIIERNKRFDNESNDSCAAVIYSMIKDNDPKVYNGICNLFGMEDKDEGIYLWGLGHHGKAMYRYLTGEGMPIKGIIDEKNAGQIYDGYTIISPDMICSDFRIFISIADKKTTRFIENMLNSKDLTIKTVDYKQLLQYISRFVH